MNNTENMNCTENESLEEIFKIATLHLDPETDGDIRVVVPIVTALPDITTCVEIAGTRYTVTGEYGGNISLADKISQIIKRDMEG